jgi:tetratricopeptide (TPR) repeat protein
MLKNTARAFGISLFLGAAVLTAGALSSSPATAAQTITNRAVGVPFQEAQTLHRQGQLQPALAKLREARGAEGITNNEIVLIDRTIAAWLLEARDYRAAMNAFEGLGDRGIDRDRSYEAALGAAMQINDTAKITALIAKMPGGAANAELFMAQGAYNNKRFQEAVTRARPFLQRNPPNLQALMITSAACFELKDEACRRNSLEQLVLHHPSEQRWCDFLRLTGNTRGLTDEQQLEILTLRQAKGCLKTEGEYLEMGQIALIAKFPAEGKAAINKGIAAKILNPQPGDRVSRLVALTDTSIATDQRTTPQLVAAANADATGNADVRLGRHHLSYGRYAEAEAAVQKGVTKGKVTDMDYARIVLGRAQLAQNKKAEAVRTLNAVPANSKHRAIARLWSIYAQQS